MRLAGKVILVTGACGGIGRAATRALLDEGAKVVASDQLEEPKGSLPETGNGDLVYLPTDLTIASDRTRLVEKCRDQFGRLDGVFANHGAILGKPFLETSEADWDRIHLVNSKSTYFLIQGLVPMMPSGASIVIVSSAAGILARPSMSAYSSSKASLNMMAKSLSLDLADRGIRVNAISPGLVDTPMPRNFLSKLEEPKALWEAMISKSPLKRAALPSEIVGMVIHLLSEEASYTTGAVIPIDGGRTAS